MKLRRFTAKDFNWERSATVDASTWQTVQTIVNSIRDAGDATQRDGQVRSYVVQHDRQPDAQSTDWRFRVPEAALAAAWDGLPKDLKESLAAAAERIRAFHELQLPKDAKLTGSNGEVIGLTWRPIERVGVYAPGGSAPLMSTALMNVIPAQVAGVAEIALASPPQRDTGLPHTTILAVAHLLGVREVYRVGGAQAIAAMAYGTSEIAKVDKIAGPGNIYVALAKRSVMGDVGIDSLAGPSEVFVVADETANARFVAADMIAQAEHDVEAGSVCVTTSSVLADAVEQELERQLATLPRADVVRQALERWGCIVQVATLDEAMDVVNKSAPEHLEVHVKDAIEWLPKVRCAGAVFLGEHTPEPVGDYYAGSNHVLPTHGSARFASGLGVSDFLRRMSYVAYNEAALQAHSAHIQTLARAEQLEGHARSVQVRSFSEEV